MNVPASALVVALAMAPATRGASDPEQTPTFRYLHDAPPHRVRAALETLSFLALDWSLLWVTPPPTADPPGDVKLIDKLRLKAWSFDASAYETNFVAHPVAGTLYYTMARSNRLGSWESFAWAVGASTLWELIEFPENVSYNDLVVTPLAGAAIGENLVQLATWLDRGRRTPGRAVLSAILFPLKALHDSLDGATLLRGDDPGGALSLSAHAIAGSLLGSGAAAEAGIQLSSRLVRFPGYGRPGEAARVGLDGNVTALSFEARAAGSGLADLRFSADAGFATVYARSIGSGLDGWDLLAAAGPGYETRWHRWNGRGGLDAWSTVHIPGVAAEVRWLSSPWRVSARLEAAIIFGGARSLVLDANRESIPIETLPTSQRAWGYTFGWGYAVGPAVDIAYGPVSLAAGARTDELFGLVRPDPWPDRFPTVTIRERWTTLSARASVRLPWSDLELSTSIERQLRWSRADALTRTMGDTTALASIGFFLE